MQISFNIVVVLLGVVIAQSVFASGLLFFSKNNKLSSRLLAVLLLAIALWLTDDFMRIGKIYRQQPSLYFMPIFYSFSFGPLIYFYVRSLINSDFRFKRMYLLHFIPVALQAILYWTLAFCSYGVKNWYWTTIHQAYTYKIEFDGTWISLLIYLMLSFRLLQQYQVWVENNFSEVSKIKLNWLKVILAILLVLCVQWFIEVWLRDLKGNYFEYDYSVEILGIVALVMGIAGLRQTNLSGINYEVADVSPEIKTAFLPDPVIMKRISDIMEQKRLYLNPTLTLVELSSSLKLNPKAVSRHINSGYQKSFNDFVNAYRVEEVKRRLTSENLEKLTIMGIAMDSGFNSKTTFNRIFKEFTGVAPSNYIK